MSVIEEMIEKNNKEIKHKMKNVIPFCKERLEKGESYQWLIDRHNERIKRLREFNEEAESLLYKQKCFRWIRDCAIETELDIYDRHKLSDAEGYEYLALSVMALVNGEVEVD